MALNIDDFSSDYAGLTPIKVTNQGDSNLVEYTLNSLLNPWFEYALNFLLNPWFLAQQFASPAAEEPYKLPGIVEDGDEGDPTNNSVYGKISGLTDPENVQKDVYRIIRQEGLTHTLAAAILGNIEHESRFDPYIKGDNGKAWGLFLMWEPARNEYAAWKAKENNKTRIKGLPDYLALVMYICDLMKARKYKASGMDPKLAWLWWDSDDVEKATEAFCRIYERPGTPMLDKRKVNAKRFYKLFIEYKDK